MKATRPYGLWDSMITPASLAEERRLGPPQWDSDGTTLVWLEGRSDRGVLVSWRMGEVAPRDLTSDLSVRAEVGYGGGDFTVHGGQVYFVVHKDGRLFRQPLAGGLARPVTPRFGQAASPCVSPDDRWLVYVHHDGKDDRLAVVDSTGGGWPQILAQGHDFYMQPCWSPDGRRLAYIAWDHPNMPWDGTLLYLAEVEYPAHGTPRLVQQRVVAGGPEVSVFQPEFTLDGRRLLFVSDETGWGRLACLDLAGHQRRWLTPEGVEYATPAWLQGQRTYCICADGRRLAAAANEQGFVRLEQIDIDTGTRHTIATLADYTDVNYPVSHPHLAKVALLAGSPRIPTRLVVYDLESQDTQVLARTNGETLPSDVLATAEPVTWPSAGEQAHGLYYAPHSIQFESPGRPPLIVIVHGGPTSQVRAGWRPEAQFFATRGYAVLFVNYRGSTGYGRDYMLRLRGNWGVCDVEDCLSGVEYLAAEGAIDRERTVIMGGSAGGFTVLQTLTQHPEAFTAGISLYGVANQFALAADTHKFESRYTDALIGPLPEAAATYRERSPVYHAMRIRRPLAVFQGDIDRVVPRNQSDAIVEALRRSGTPHEYHVYQGEGHGWRKRETIEHYYRAVEAFLRRYVIYS